MAVKTKKRSVKVRCNYTEILTTVYSSIPKNGECGCYNEFKKVTCETLFVDKSVDQKSTDECRFALKLTRNGPGDFKDMIQMHMLTMPKKRTTSWLFFRMEGVGMGMVTRI